MPGAAVSLRIDGLDEFAQKFSSLPALVEGGVKCLPPASDYALTWEFGSARITKAGPKTVESINPLGQPAILTLTAPFGYIRSNHQAMIAILKEEFGKVKWADLAPDRWEAAAKEMMNKAATRAAKVVSDAAPIDSGDLRQCIVAALAGDEVLVTGTSNDFGPTDFNIGAAWL